MSLARCDWANSRFAKKSTTSRTSSPSDTNRKTQLLYKIKTFPPTTSTELQQKEDQGYGVFSAFSGNPGKAALYSLVLPGAGQAYNKRWWKVPIAVGIEGVVIYNLQKSVSEFRDWDTAWKQSVRGEPVDFEKAELLSTNGIMEERNSARQNRDLAWVALIGAHIIIAADAFVDRHMIEFDIDDDLSLRFSPVSPYPGVNLALQF